VPGSNQRPLACKASALPTELTALSTGLWPGWRDSAARRSAISSLEGGNPNAGDAVDLPSVAAVATHRAAAIVLSALAALLGFIAVYLLFGLGNGSLETFTLEWIYNGVIIAAGLVCMTRALASGAERAAWALLGSAFVLWGVGNVYWTFWLLPLEEPPFPSLADAFWLAIYPPSYVGLVLLLRSRFAEFRASLWLDGVIAGLALAALSAAVVFDTVLEATGGSHPTAVATNLTYPLADLVLLALVVASVAASGWRPDRTLALLALGLVAFTVSDSFFLYQTAIGAYVAGTPVDLGWLAASVLVAWAAWQPRVRLRPVIRDGWWVLLPPVAFALLGIGLMVYDHYVRINPLALALATAALVAVLARLAITFAENIRMLGASRHEARTDALTGLGNRRKLMDDLTAVLDSDDGVHVLALFDLNGFKHYNDSYGHPAGDALLVRLAGNLELAVRGRGCAYRMGGDEFCVLFAPAAEPLSPLVKTAASALFESGEGFSIGTAYGVVGVPQEAETVSAALRLADQRLYSHKHRFHRGSPSDQSESVLVQALVERHPELGSHVDDVARLAEEVARRLGVDEGALQDVRRAAVLHDIGKMAVPETILGKTSPLDEQEWDFVRRHTIVGERIVRAAPALMGVAKLIRSSHERFDGTGYPDGLRAAEIPLGSRIIFVCDAFAAMTSERPYARALTQEEALQELQRGAGSQFDPVVVESFVTLARDPRRLERVRTAARDTWPLRAVEA
jgi:two-component system cell cycle response regulator